jgi:hypothetical protein
MFLGSGRSRARATIVVLLAFGAAVGPETSPAEEIVAPGFALRSHNPFLQIFGLPPLQSAALASAGRTNFEVSLDLANNADFGDTDTENLFIDGESYFVNMSLRRRMRDWLELGVDVPLVAHSGGFMDNAIKSWHDAFGMSNTKRRGPDDELLFLYQRQGATLYELNSSASGIGDIQLTAAMPIRRAAENGYALTIRTSLKLPTGDEQELRGSGAADLAAGLYVANTTSIFNRPLSLSAFAGAILLGDGDVLSDIQESAVPFGGIAGSWQVTERFSITTQLQAQGAYFDSDIDELGGGTFQLGVGFGYRPRGSDRCLTFAVVEDVQADATTDFALHFSFGNRCAR